MASCCKVPAIERSLRGTFHFSTLLDFRIFRDPRGWRSEENPSRGCLLHARRGSSLAPHRPMCALGYLPSGWTYMRGAVASALPSQDLDARVPGCGDIFAVKSDCPGSSRSPGACCVYCDACRMGTRESRHRMALPPLPWWRREARRPRYAVSPIRGACFWGERVAALLVAVARSAAEYAISFPKVRTIADSSAPSLPVGAVAGRSGA